MSIIQGTSKSSAAAAYSIDQSIRFNFSDGAHMLRTPSSASNRRTWTWSLWVKRSGLGNPGGPNQVHMLFGVGAGSCLRFTPSDELRLESPAGNHTFVTSQVFRDTSAWYHIVLAFDSTQATDTNRRKLYVNGSQVTDFSSTTFTGLAQNAEWDINSTSQHQIAKSNLADYFGGYLAELNFVDGQALAPTDFGETNADTGQWVPIAYTGSYGTNGFYITGANSADLGADDSGNGNDFTSSGLTAADQMVDTPTNNFCTLNTIEPVWGAKPTISNGNLDIAGASATVWNNAVATFKTLPSTGKWIWAAEPNTSGGGQCDPWIVNETGLASRNNYVYVDANGWETTFDSSSVHTVLNNGAGRNASFTYGSGDFHVICFDADSKKLWFGVYDVSAGTLQFHDGSTGLTGDPGAGTNPTYTLTGNEFSIGFATYTGRGGNVDFGQSDLLSQFTAPTDFKTLCTANLDDPTIADPSAYFDTLIWSGDSSNKNITGLDFTPDFLWVKQRNSAFSVGHQLYDVVRGAGSEKELDSSSTAAEGAGNPDVYGYLSAFVSGGFTATAGTSGDWDYVNKSGVTYVAWNWLADNTSGSSNTDGSTTSTVSVNTTSGFSIATYTGTGANATVGHGLGVAPSFVLVKSRNDTHDWYVWTPALATTEFLKLNSTAAKGTSSPEVWNSTAPTSSVVSLGTSIGVNRNTYNYVMYCFAEVEGFSKFGSFTGNGSSTDGPFIYTGFKPEFFMWKRTDSGTYGDWTMLDTKRDPFNMAQENLRANSTMAGDTGEANLDFVSNGIKHRGGTSARFNQSGATYVYMAFAESPFKTATAR